MEAVKEAISNMFATHPDVSYIFFGLLIIVCILLIFLYYKKRPATNSANQDVTFKKKINKSNISVDNSRHTGREE